jgi:hypothetical protein
MVLGEVLEGKDIKIKTMQQINILGIANGA